MMARMMRVLRTNWMPAEKVSPAFGGGFFYDGLFSQAEKNNDEAGGENAIG